MSELIWYPLELTPRDREFLEQQQKWQKEFAEKYSIPPQMLGEVREYTDAEKQEAQERAYQILIDAAYEVGRKHEH